jgi:hypothetical protein
MVYESSVIVDVQRIADSQMRSFSSRARWLIVLAATCSTSHAYTTVKTYRIAGRTLALKSPFTCAHAQRPRKELARYLSQYDPSDDPREDIRDETPRTRQALRLIKDGLVENGFHYPNGQDSVITWMDFNGDGLCDFTASTGIGGTKAIDRMFLFRGVPKGDFRLVESYYTYMEGRIPLVPYVPVSVSGERLPLLATPSTLMQWNNKREAFSTCDSLGRGTQAQRHAAPPVLAALCPHAQQIYAWAAGQLPHENNVPYWTPE